MRPSTNVGCVRTAIAESSIGQTGEHRHLNGAKNFAGVHAKAGEPEDAIAFYIDERFEETARFAQGASA